MPDNNQKRFDVVCLDVGDTLIHARTGWLELRQQAFAQGGLEVDLGTLAAVAAQVVKEHPDEPPDPYPPTEEYDSKRRVQRELAYLRLLGQDASREKADNLLLHLEAAYLDPSSYLIFPDVVATLEALTACHYRLGVISNWSWYLPDLVRQLGLGHFFESITVSARVGAAKPHPSIFLHALDRFRVSSDRMVHVGDNLEADVRGAQKAGITGVLIDRSDTHRSDGFPIIRSLDQLLDLIA